MKQEPAATASPAAMKAGHEPGGAIDTADGPPTAAVAANDPPAAGRGTRIGAAVIAGLIVGSLVLYVIGDRVTPHTSQARVQAYVVPVTAEVSGKVLKVHIGNDQEVQLGQPLFDVDPEPYQIALQRARADSNRCDVRSIRRSPASIRHAHP